MADKQMAQGYGMGKGMTLLTPQEVAAMLRLNYRYVRDKLAKRKDFPPAIRIGSQLRWMPEDIEQWIVKNKAQ